VSEPRKTCVADALSLCGSWASCLFNWCILSELLKVRLGPKTEPLRIASAAFGWLYKSGALHVSQTTASKHWRKWQSNSCSKIIQKHSVHIWTRSPIWSYQFWPLLNSDRRSEPNTTLKFLRELLSISPVFISFSQQLQGLQLMKSSQGFLLVRNNNLHLSNMVCHYQEKLSNSSSSSILQTCKSNIFMASTGYM